VAIGDVDADGDPEMVVTTFSANNVYLVENDATLHANWPQTTTDILSGSAVIADVSGDGIPDVIVADRLGNLYAWHSDGQIVDGFPKYVGGPVYGSVAVGDIDYDGDIEIAVVNMPGSPFLAASVFDLDKSFDVNSLEWPMFQHNLQHTGNYDMGMTSKPQSKIVNTGKIDLEGNLIIKLQEKSGDDWQDVSIVINQPEIIKSGETLKLDQLWNPNDVKTSVVGKYRVYAALTQNGEVIQTSTGVLETSWEFNITCGLWDVDNDGKVVNSTDGLLIVRYLLEFTGKSLNESALGSGAKRTNSEDIVDYISSLDTDYCLLDVDGDGVTDGLSDGVMIYRYMSGVIGGELIDQSVYPDAKRKTPEEILYFLRNCGNHCE
ncbi:MAG: VCBS repeat-containing protein, partial [Nanoarchaeota archaeon]